MLWPLNTNCWNWTKCLQFVNFIGISQWDLGDPPNATRFTNTFFQYRVNLMWCSFQVLLTPNRRVFYFLANHMTSWKKQDIWFALDSFCWKECIFGFILVRAVSKKQNKKQKKYNPNTNAVKCMNQKLFLNANSTVRTWPIWNLWSLQSGSNWPIHSNFSH